jgi:hypothetical protein
MTASMRGVNVRRFPKRVLSAAAKASEISQKAALAELIAECLARTILNRQKS